MGLTGCSSLSLDRKVDYRSSQPGPSLELPPDLKSPAFDNTRYAVPDRVLPKSTTTTLSPVAIGEQTPSSPRGAQTQVATLVKSGQQRWALVKLPPEKVWKLAHEFWVQTGFKTLEERPETGVLETDWAENRAKIPQDIIRNTIGRVLDMLYSTSERDKFRTRLERNASGETEVYISHKGMIEVADSATDARVYKWQPRPSDPELEAEMLQRFILSINEPERFKSPKKDKDTNTPIATQERPDRASVSKNPDGSITLDVQDSLDSTWQRTSLAVERLGFTLEDRNRQQGTFVLRYSTEGVPDKKTWADKMSFWKASDKATTALYRLKLTSKTQTNTAISMESIDGKAVDRAVSEPILSLLQGQLR